MNHTRRLRLFANCYKGTLKIVGANIPQEVRRTPRRKKGFKAYQFGKQV
jgi:hypothetical protein